jgi:hypothetical protein
MLEAIEYPNFLRMQFIPLHCPKKNLPLFKKFCTFPAESLMRGFFLLFSCRSKGYLVQEIENTTLGKRKLWP